ncbi:MAG: UDP-N-acetylmuramate dehydrogenase [Pseudomonadales bacterium]|nr:UDP-N-acetylmuramate dehydrogenase [Pseudomonadales bacterium]
MSTSSNANTGVSLKQLNTLALNAQCNELIEIDSVDQLRTALAVIRNDQTPFLVIGSGSNLVFSQDFAGTVLQIATKGIQVLEEGDQHVTLSVAGGEIWDEFVGHCVTNGYYGLENLSGIPGTVGAAPVQNIGAYGVELQQTLVSLEAIEIETGQLHLFSHKECEFDYRDSTFKNAAAGKYVITEVVIKLSKHDTAQRNLSYKGLADEFRKQGVSSPDACAVRRVIKQVRDSKLPNPKRLPNAGSFFKNPVIATETYHQLVAQHPNIVSFAVKPGQIKLAASWLIEQARWKGYRDGDAGVFAQHALILVNHGNASGSDILNLAEKIQTSVFQKFGVALEIEPVVI